MAHEGRHSAGIYLSLLILGLVVIVQGALLARLHFFGASPNLLLVVVVCWSLLRSVPEGLLWAFAGGLGVDLVAGLPLGMTALALMPTCFLAGLGRSRVFAGSLTLPMLLVALATPLFGWLNLLILQARGLPVDWAGATLRVIVPELILNLLLVPVVYPLLRWFAARWGIVWMEW